MITQLIGKWKMENGKSRALRGFTMIELILYMGLFSILLLVLLQIFSSILSVHLESQATSSIDQEANLIMSRLTYDVHRASAITTPSLGSQGSTLQITGSNLDETYAITSNNLQLTDNIAHTTNIMNSPDVTPTITFKTLGNTVAGNQKSVQITLILTSTIKRTGGLTETQTYTTTVQTRP
jgi:type II secretory pathway component PulJ